MDTCKLWKKEQKHLLAKLYITFHLHVLHIKAYGILIHFHVLLKPKLKSDLFFYVKSIECN